MISLKDDPLVGAEDYGLLVEPMYFQQGISSDDACWMRRTLAEKLMAARAHLPESWNFKVWDAFRKMAVQQRLYDDLYKKLEQENGAWDDAQIHRSVREFVSEPTKDPLNAAPHNTGGAVDLTLIDDQGQEIDMGTPFDHFEIEAHTMHYKEAKPGTPEAKWHENRMILYEALTKEGLFNYPEEWWHFSYGDREWASNLGTDILYPSAEEDLFTCQI